ncbi:MAG TPA: imidazolonepropionase [Prolixibacteraceae bacterium]|nr:imidazolonepropionase [Prolixibacteraceae bacterium]
MKLIGPFVQLLTMDQMPLKGALSDDQLVIIYNGGVLIDGQTIIEVGTYDHLLEKYAHKALELEKIEKGMVAMPGFIDAHTHICWAGSRAADYAKRLSGKTYLEIATEGGGIWSTVQKTREASMQYLQNITDEHANQMLNDGVTTIEVKSGYGLTVADELKILQAIKSAPSKADLVPTCLAAHICPNDFNGSKSEYLLLMVNELLPEVKRQKLSNRVDVFVEPSAFGVGEANFYLQKAKELGFDLVVHGDQFNVGGSQLAIEMCALSVDHLEASGQHEMNLLGKSNVVSVVLPGASLGLGMPFAPARKLLDSGACLVIASDWNPGSAPMGDLLMQAAILGAYEKLTLAETLAAITVRAASALNLSDRGVLSPGRIADIIAFRTSDFRDIVNRQGKLKPSFVWKRGEKLALQLL